MKIKNTTRFAIQLLARVLPFASRYNPPLDAAPVQQALILDQVTALWSDQSGASTSSRSPS